MKLINLSEVLASSEPVLVDVFTDSCMPCRRMAPLMDEMAAEGYKVTKINAMSAPDFCLEHSIDAVPTFLVFKNGVVVNRLQGAQTKAALVSALQV